MATGPVGEFTPQSTSTSNVEENLPKESINDFASQSTSTGEVEEIGNCINWAIVVPVLSCAIGVGLFMSLHYVWKKRKSLCESHIYDIV